MFHPDHVWETKTTRAEYVVPLMIHHETQDGPLGVDILLQSILA